MPVSCCIVVTDGSRQQLGELTVGQIVKARVTSVTDVGVLCTLHDGVRGLVTTDHMPGSLYSVSVKFNVDFFIVVVSP